MTAPKLRKGDLAVIHWNDAWTNEGYTRKNHEADLLKPFPCISVGFVAAIDKATVALAQTIDPEGDWRFTHTIPKKYITKIVQFIAETPREKA